MGHSLADTIMELNAFWRQNGTQLFILIAMGIVLIANILVLHNVQRISDVLLEREQRRAIREAHVEAIYPLGRTIRAYRIEKEIEL